MTFNVYDKVVIKNRLGPGGCDYKNNKNIVTSSIRLFGKVNCC